MATTILMMTSAIFAFGECSDADKKALEAFDRAWGNAETREALEPFYADDFRNIGLLGTTNKEQALTNIAPADPNVTFDHYVISCTANTATISHRVVIKSNENGRTKTAYQRVIHFLEKRGGKWQAVSSAGNPITNEGYILAMEMDLAQAVKIRDAKWFEQNVADDYIGDNFDGKTETKAQLIDRIKNQKRVYETINLSEVKTRLNGDAATLMGLYHLTGKDENGRLLDIKMRFSRMYIKKDGNWMLAADTDYLLSDNK